MRASILLTSVLIGLYATGAFAVPLATKSKPGCGDIADAGGFGRIAFCNQVSGTTDSWVAASATTCAYSPPTAHGTIAGPAVAYKGTALSNDGTGTFLFVGGPKILPGYGLTASYGEQHRSYTPPGSKPGTVPVKQVRFGAFIFAAGKSTINKFFPSGGWLRDAGPMTCKAIHAACINPFAGAGWTPERTDEGVDYGALKGPLPVKAICDGTIVASGPSRDGWEPYWIQYKLSSGPFAGKCIYVAEHLSQALPVGTRVTAGQTIAVAQGQTEWGWAYSFMTPSSPGPDAAQTGKPFARFLRSLGAPTAWDPGPGPMWAGNACHDF